MSSTELAPVEKAPSQAALLAVIAEAARDPHVDAAKMLALWNLKKDIDAQDAKNAFYRAMQAVQEEIRPVVRDAQNNHTQSKYAKLESIDRAIRPIYTHHGFSLTFGARTDAPGSLTITCECMHREGHTAHYELPGSLDATNKAKTDIQALGSTITYLRRYLTCLVWNVVLTNEDDDGNYGSCSADALSQEQLNKLLDLVADMPEATKQSFLRYMGVSALEQIPARQFTMAVTALNAKRRSLQK